MQRRIGSAWWSALACALLAVSSATATAKEDARQPSAAMRIAMEYIEAYGAFDLDRVESLYAETAVFTDPTSFDFRDFGAPYHWEGRDAIMAQLRKLKCESGVESVRYLPSQVYEASGRVVFVADLKPVYRTKGGVVRTKVPIVTVVTVKDGRVVEHRDYADYDRLERLDADGV